LPGYRPHARPEYFITLADFSHGRRLCRRPGHAPTSSESAQLALTRISGIVCCAGRCSHRQWGVWVHRPAFMSLDPAGRCPWRAFARSRAAAGRSRSDRPCRAPIRRFAGRLAPGPYVSLRQLEVRRERAAGTAWIRRVLL